MKKIYYLTIIWFILFPTLASAHPGNTDSAGGHTCRTNCEKWGLDYGEYHYHNGGGEYDGGTYDEGYEKGYNIAYQYTSKCNEDYEWWWEGSQAYGNGFEDGIADGHKDGLTACKQMNEEVSSDSVDVSKIGVDTGPTQEEIYEEEKQQWYQQGRVDGYYLYALTFNEFDDKVFKESYLDGYKMGIAELSDEAREAGYKSAYESPKVNVPKKFLEPTDAKSYSESEYFSEMDADELYDTEKELGIDISRPEQAFLKGFNNNEDARHIREKAQEDGRFFRAKQELTTGQVLYDAAYEDAVLSNILGGVGGIFMIYLSVYLYKKRKR